MPTCSAQLDAAGPRCSAGHFRCIFLGQVSAFMLRIPCRYMDFCPCYLS